MPSSSLCKPSTLRSRQLMATPRYAEALLGASLRPRDCSPARMAERVIGQRNRVTTGEDQRLRTCEIFIQARVFWGSSSQMITRMAGCERSSRLGSVGGIRLAAPLPPSSTFTLIAWFAPVQPGDGRCDRGDCAGRCSAQPPINRAPWATSFTGHFEIFRAV